MRGAVSGWLCVCSFDQPSFDEVVSWFPRSTMNILNSKTLFWREVTTSGWLAINQSIHQYFQCMHPIVHTLQVNFGLRCQRKRALSLLRISSLVAAVAVVVGGVVVVVVWVPNPRHVGSLIPRCRAYFPSTKTNHSFETCTTTKSTQYID
jgi:hypothetical protein